ncbi:hypothetical protein AC578_9103 [Pseudocercospora eumusae]|uniref:Uncharacterized protein n=1 Tax=Pseudocercospora eumusae TaxID=321146 RepID=A0A139HUY1_9PEZI|nr:hypothetical protein AC578_9103 [Pseudocercospora eumusae]
MKQHLSTTKSIAITRASTNDLLLITSASGKQGPAIPTHLAPKWKGKLRLQCQSNYSAAERLKEKYPSAEIIAANFKTPSLAEAA